MEEPFIRDSVRLSFKERRVPLKPILRYLTGIIYLNGYFTFESAKRSIYDVQN